MKKRLALSLTICLSFIIFSCAESKKPPEVTQPQGPAPIPKLTGPKKRVGIFAFKNKSRYGQNKLTQAAVDVLYSELEKSNLFNLYERADLAELEKEFDLIETKKVSPAAAAQKGQWVGVQAVIIGTITQFGLWEEAKDYGAYKKKTEIAECTVDVRVVDVTNGQIITADSGTGRTERSMETTFGLGAKGSYDETMADKALRDSIDKFIDNLIRRLNEMPWEGKVVDLDTSGSEQTVYVNAGRKSQMPKGAKLAVYQVTGKLTDPETGQFLGYKTRRVAAAEVFDFAGEDVSMARVTSGAGSISKGDIVKLEQDVGK